jgi:hypothetical protein
VQPLPDLIADRAAMDVVDLDIVVQHGYPACRANVARREILALACEGNFRATIAFHSKFNYFDMI